MKEGGSMMTAEPNEKVTAREKQARRKVRRRPLQFDGWVGFVDGAPSLYGDQNYYGGVRHGDWFASKKEANKCYEDVRRVRIVVVDAPDSEE